jgi:hypothetical protein
MKVLKGTGAWDGLTIPTADNLPLFHDSELNQNKFIHQSANYVQAFRYIGLE